MHTLTFGVSRRLAQVYDAMLDRYQQNEEALAHACIRILVHFGDSINDEQSDEIYEKLAVYQQDEGDDEEYFEREIIVDAPTHAWLRLLSDRHRDKPEIEMMFMNGVILTSIMFEVVKEKPTAHLTSIITQTPVEVPIQQLLETRPQFYN